MIFLTVGSQTPFDRLVTLVDEWAERSGRKVFAQIGKSSLKPKYIEWRNMLDTDEFLARCAECDFIVAHAGTGSIITALELGKTILVLPRRAAFKETRNDHQFATVKHLAGTQGLEIAMDEKELLAKLDALSEHPPHVGINPHASGLLLDTLRNFILNGKKPT